MKLKTRLWVTLIAIVLGPFLLTSIAFIAVGSHVEGTDSNLGLLDKRNLATSYTVENYSHMTEEVLEDVKEQIGRDTSRLEDTAYLEQISSELNDKFSYIIVRKDNRIYYTGNESEAKKILAMLPEYGKEMPDSETGFYYNDLKKLVKQLDFRFADGSAGSFFIVTSVHTLISRSALRQMIIALILALCLTGILLTRLRQRYRTRRTTRPMWKPRILTPKRRSGLLTVSRAAGICPRRLPRKIFGETTSDRGSPGFFPVLKDFLKIFSKTTAVCGG